MLPIELIYKTIFNHFVKQKGYNSYTHIEASLAAFMFNGNFLLNIYTLINIILNHSIALPFKNNAIGFPIFISLIIINHFLLFKILKFSKTGDGVDHLFKMDKKTFFLGWFVFIANMLLTFSIVMVWTLFFK